MLHQQRPIIWRIVVECQRVADLAEVPVSRWAPLGLRGLRIRLLCNPNLTQNSIAFYWFRCYERLHKGTV